MGLAAMTLAFGENPAVATPAIMTFRRAGATGSTVPRAPLIFEAMLCLCYGKN